MELDEVLLGFLAEHVDHVAAEGDVDLGAEADVVLLLAGQIDGGQDDDGVLAFDVDVHMDGGAHEFSKKYHLVQTLKMTNVMFR